MSYSTAQIWIIILGIGIGTWVLRFSFMGLVGDRTMPLWFERGLRYVGIGIMPAIVAPLIAWPTATDGAFDPARFGAAVATFIVTFWTKNVLYGLIAGLLTLYGLLYLIG